MHNSLLPVVEYRGVADGQFAGKRREVCLAEYLGDQAHLGMDCNAITGVGGDACAFLSPVLEGEEAEEGETAGRLCGGVHSDYPAFLAGAVERAIDLVEVRLTIHGLILSAPLSNGQQRKRPESVLCNVSKARRRLNQWHPGLEIAARSSR